MSLPSREHISAFVDGELSRREVADMLKAMGEDKELAESACELRTLKLMVRHAYEDALEKSAPSSPSWRGNMAKAIAATLLIALGSLTGWKLHESASTSRWASAPIVPHDAQAVRLAIKPNAERVILHIDNDKPDQVRAALERASALLKNAQANHQDAHIEILANSNGLNMLRRDRSQEAARIAQIADAYPHNVRFVACGQTINRLEHEGQVIKLLPQVQIVPSALDEIVTHLQRGWTYIKV